MNYMKKKGKTDNVEEPDSSGWQGTVWNKSQMEEVLQAKIGKCIILIDGFAVDVTSYLGEHVSR